MGTVIKLPTLYNRSVDMKIEDFERLGEAEQRVLIFGAEKLTERNTASENIQLFKIDNFFVEVMTSLKQKLKRHIHTYSFKNLPVEYSRVILQ